MGPAGELRYPSYNGHDNNSGYPTRGAFQSYSEPAKADFRNWALNKYGSLNGINNAWGFSLSNINQVNPPSNAYNFVQNADHFNMAYGRDFIRWYHEALRSHGIRMMDAAINAFDQSMKYKDLGFKIPGVHWQMGAGGGFYRSAEIAAGLIPTDVDLNANYTAHGYSSIISIADSFNWSSHEIVLHFTCLEMSNQNWHPQYSKAQDLVFWVASGASDQGVPIKGENALNGGVQSNTGWNNIENAFNWASYSGLTVLRINDVTSGGTGQYRMGNFIWNY
jgi:hypothetical protein